jgi:glycosyltransferase involved in cell wall biosynthesis
MTGHRAVRVVLVNPTFEHGFPDPDALIVRYHSLTGWANALAEAGADAVTVVQRFQHEAAVRRGRVDFRFVTDGAPPYPSHWFWGKLVAHAVRSVDPTAVHVESLAFPMLVRHVRLKLHRQSAILLRDHGGYDVASPTFRTRSRRAFYRLGLRAADGVLFTASAQAEPWLRARIISDPTAVYEVPEASTDMASWPTGTDDSARLPGRPALLWVARLDSNKDPLTLLEGFERAAAAAPAAALTLVYGEDQLLRDVQLRIASSPVLRTRVHLRGKVDRRDLPSIYAGADVFVLGSHHEVACFSLLEALSFGVTPIVTDIPPFRVLTAQGKLGALFPAGDAGALAQAIERLCHDDFTARRRAVREHFERELSWAAIGRRGLAICRAALARRTSSLSEEPGS